MTTTDLGLGETLTQDISAVLESFTDKDPAGKAAFAQLLASHPRIFGGAAIRILGKRQPSPGSRYLAHLLTKEKLLPAGLLDAKATGMEEAVTILRAVAANGTNLQPMLELALNRALLDQPSPENTARILRLLELLAAIAAASSWNAFQLELMAYPDGSVRSKATLLIGRGTKNVAWIGRRLLDRDARVQASAVEALWVIEAGQARPLLITASKSKHNRVAGNAALGLYRIGDLKAIPMLFEMARQPDEDFRMSGLWAIGETQDPRFLPFLMEQFKTSRGKVRLAVTRALGCMRRREKAAAEAGTFGIRVSEAQAGRDGARLIAFALTAPPAVDLSSLKPTELAVWESGVLIEDYDVKLPSTTAVLAGFVVPRFVALDDPYAQAVAAVLERCSASKRPDDLWRIDRYSIQPPQAGSETPAEKTDLPYDEAVMTQDLKMRHSFIADRELLSKVISSEVPFDRTAPDSFRAIERQVAAVRKLPGLRHVFVFLHHDSLASLEDEAHLRALKDIVTQERIILHGFAPGPSHDCAGFQNLCLSSTEGTFINTTSDLLPDAVLAMYTLLMNGCEISYRLPPDVAAGPVVLKVSSNQGAAQAELTLRAVD